MFNDLVTAYTESGLFNEVLDCTRRQSRIVGMNNGNFFTKVDEVIQSKQSKISDLAFENFYSIFYLYFLINLIVLLIYLITLFNMIICTKILFIKRYIQILF